MAALLFHSDTLAHLPPLLINLGLLWLFGRTLLPGRKPLITALAEQARGPLKPPVRHYTRQVTKAWTLFIALLGVETLLLSLWASPELWALFAYGLNYLIIILFFLAEYGFRRIWLADLEHPSFRQYLRFLGQTDWRGIARR
ncbi:MAG: hypothetical protein H6969_03220 [Gammaproteobacteria bacterium]|nr:hypothetical protein [Gammaproteobacteria bacterium]MCP5459577.1 hypothetical protein [Gammaproteobacteria bacterium]